MIFDIQYMRTAEVLRKEIEKELFSIGILCRVFGRGKTHKSLKEKLDLNPEKYSPKKKLIQDAVGIRVVLYFQEDVQIVDSVLRLKYICDDISSTIDKPTNNIFSVSRYNLIFRLPEVYFRDIDPPTPELPVDRSFEVQIRTILSEGWHEVEHDLRYKRKTDWQGSDDLSRGLNGVLATLETAEWSMRKIFDELAYKHYKNRKWDGLIHSALRMRIISPLSQNVLRVFESTPYAAHELIRINRTEVISALSKLAPRIPLFADNIIFVWNKISIKNEELKTLTPGIITDTINAAGI